MTWERLDPCNGPPCPECGCRDTEIITPPRDNSKIGWYDSGRARCNHCHTWFHFKEIPQSPAIEHQEPVLDTPPVGHAVPYIRVQCPECQSVDAPVTHTQRPVRYHKCGECGRTFKSVEQTLPT